MAAIGGILLQKSFCIAERTFPSRELTSQATQAGAEVYRQFDPDYASDEEIFLAVYRAMFLRQPSDSFR